MLKIVNNKIIIYCIIGIYILSSGLIYLLNWLVSLMLDESVSIFNVLYSGAGLSVVFILILCHIWDYIWKRYPILSKFIFPNLNGKWKITIKWEDKIGNKGEVIGDCIIHQSIFSISINIDTPNSKSETLTVSPEKNHQTGEIKLFYIYKNEVKNKGNKPHGMYDGAAMLKISPSHSILEGNYFTSKQGFGYFELVRNENSN